MPNRVRLDETTIPALPVPPAGDLIHWCDRQPGFGLRVSSRGKRTWIAQWRFGRQRRITLGYWPEMKADRARKAARDALAAARTGRDPQTEKRDAKAKAALTLGAVVERYLMDRAEPNLRPRTLVELRRYLREHWKPLHPLPAADVPRTKVAERLDELRREAGPIAANRARSCLLRVYTWAMRRGLVEANPVLGTEAPAEERSRERVLSFDELAEIWRACRDDDHGRIVRLLMLTGQRREEVAALRWRELSADRTMWTLPGERTKNRRPHEVPLSSLARAILVATPIRDGRELVFGEGVGGFSGWSRCKERLDARILAARRRRAEAAGLDSAAVEPMPGWTLHDLRRSFATLAGEELGAPPHVVEAVLNHVSGHKAGVAGVYNRALYRAEKAAVLQAWADRLAEAVVGRPAKVLPMRRSAV